MTGEFLLSNARIVLETEVIEGSVLLRDGLIADLSTGSSSGGEDCGGDYLIPGLVELHTDHLEAHYAPRPGVRWDTTAAIQAHDAQVASSGITTVFDCLRLGADEDGGYASGEMRTMADAIAAAAGEDRLKADHYIHLRCEVSASDVMADFAGFETDPMVRLVSLMDHAPGQRQFQTMDQYILFYKTRRGLSDKAFDEFVARRVEASELYSRPHRDQIAAHCNARGIAMASHDDATLDHVAESVFHGVKVAEFPTSIDAARASHEAGLSVLMGGPNIVRGKSHSGNISARDLARLGYLDVISSDYIPLSLLYAPFLLSEGEDGLPLAKTIAMVTSTPAQTVGLSDRGAIRPGLRGDLVRVQHTTGVPVVRSVWRQGRRVC
jgi:alpha-D-ribose 1-methylphosphonate 5-triphosphate diphosphatase